MKTITFPRMHASLYVSDLQRSMKFYSGFFGQEPSKIRTGYAKYELTSPALIISFIENPERVQANFGHLGFQVGSKEELENLMEKAQSADLVNKIEMGTACCYAKQDKFWAVDPDGVQWEVYYFHEDAEFNDPKFEEEMEQNCCISVQEPKSSIQEEKAACCGPESTCC